MRWKTPIFSEKSEKVCLEDVREGARADTKGRRRKERGVMGEHCSLPAEALN